MFWIALHLKDKDISFKIVNKGNSLVIQWLGSVLPLQQTRV